MQIIEVKTDSPIIEQKIRATFPEQPNTMVAVFQAESELNPRAYNPEAHRGCISSRGVAQIACVNYSGDLEDLYDVDINLQVARKVYDSQGIEAWGSFTDSRYLLYLN